MKENIEEAPEESALKDAIGVIKSERSTLNLGLAVLAGLAVYAGFAFLANRHAEGEDWGAVSLLPTLFVLAVSLISRRPFESMIAGVFAGLVMLNPTNLITPFSEHLSEVMMNETIVWVVLVCGLMGGLIQLLEYSGCFSAFAGWMRVRVKTRKQSLQMTFAIGLIVFIDDYLNCLAVSSAMKKLTDHYKVSREKLAYIIDSTAAPMCVIVPVSTWAVYFAGLLEENGLAGSGGGMSLYVSAIPFMVYGWVALFLVFLVASGYLGNLGPMKAAEERALAGQPIPTEFIAREQAMVSHESKHASVAIGLFNFGFPMVLLVLSTVYYDIDLLKGVMLTVAMTVILYYVQGLMSFVEQVEALFDGFKVMLYPLSTVIAGFLLKEVNDTLGMTQYIIDGILPWMTREMLPALVFVSLATVVFGTASSWGVFIIAIPIVVPTALAVDANMPLVIGALLSASSFGSHACFFSDSTVLAAQGAGCSPMDHAMTQMPYVIIGAIATFIVFVALGHMV